VYNVIGQEVARLSEGTKEAGIHEVRFEAGGYSSGVYICRLRAGDLVQSRAMMLVK
jgi:hypothetical protein